MKKEYDYYREIPKGTTFNDEYIEKFSHEKIEVEQFLYYVKVTEHELKGSEQLYCNCPYFKTLFSYYLLEEIALIKPEMIKLYYEREVLGIEK